ncbi:MAG TPA: FtsW/RodA/SpoVE family cell cycle protein [Patescibacteria group bacterium]|nr:FtsW/RodA/SpoVE family cell cycle protein [Patescibacteria group bacterium]
MRKKHLLGIDWWLVTPVIALLAIGLVTLLSLSKTLFLNQLFTLGVGILGFYLISRLRIESLQRLSLPIYLASLVLLFIVLIIGFESRGAVRWISIFGFPIQFSEVLKPFLTLALATYLGKSDNRSPRAFVMSLVLLLPVFLLIAFQPDLGNALIYAGVTLLILLVYGFPLKWFVFLFLPGLLVSPFLWAILHDYQRKRFLTFLNPTSDPLGASYNVIQAMIAVGSGMFLGKGLSQGTQSGLRFLPERHTDFIFATLSEGLGFVGAFIILVAFCMFCLRIYMLFQSMEDNSARLFAVGTFGFVLIHFFVNIGMNVGLLPIVGVTLPFVSYGGSSLLSNFIFLGLLSAMISTYSHSSVLEIR